MSAGARKKSLLFPQRIIAFAQMYSTPSVRKAIFAYPEEPSPYLLCCCHRGATSATFLFKAFFVLAGFFGCPALFRRPSESSATSLLVTVFHDVGKTIGTRFVPAESFGDEASARGRDLLEETPPMGTSRDRSREHTIPTMIPLREGPGGWKTVTGRTSTTIALTCCLPSIPRNYPSSKMLNREGCLRWRYTYNMSGSVNSVMPFKHFPPVPPPPSPASPRPAHASTRSAT